jgi:hypothetical protein
MPPIAVNTRMATLRIGRGDAALFDLPILCEGLIV